MSEDRLTIQPQRPERRRRACVCPGRLLGPVALALALAIPGRVHAQECLPGPGNAFAFLALDGSPSSKCPASPIVRWFDPHVVFECGFFTDPVHAIRCGASPAGCAAICRGAAATWNAELPGRFTFEAAGASTPVGFCDPEDGATSVGGSTTVCDGSAFGPNVLAVTYRINFVGGSDNGRLVDADITVNQAFDDFFAADPDDLRATVGHELGHVLGLDHPDQCGRDFNVLMRSASLFAADDPCFVVEPTADDVVGGQLIYAVTGPTPSPLPTPGLCGDADGDGAVTVTDGVLTLRAAAALSSPCTAAQCDVDGSGAVTVTDGVNVLRAAAGLPFASNCPR